MVLAIMDLATGEATEFAAGYMALVTQPNVPWRFTESEREHLWSKLVERAQRGEVVFKGVRDAVEGAVTISGNALRGSKPNFLADTLEVGGTVYHAIGVFEASQVPASSTLGVSPSQPGGDRKGKGGPQEKYDWPSFQRELTRALYEGGLPDRRAIRNHMVDWCKQWNPAPDESRIRQKLAEYWHPDIPEKAER